MDRRWKSNDLNEIARHNVASAHCKHAPARTDKAGNRCIEMLPLTVELIGNSTSPLALSEVAAKLQGGWVNRGVDTAAELCPNIRMLCYGLMSLCYIDISRNKNNYQSLEGI